MKNMLKFRNLCAILKLFKMYSDMIIFDITMQKIVHIRRNFHFCSDDKMVSQIAPLTGSKVIYFWNINMNCWESQILSSSPYMV